jgi:hypothetical protein
MLPLKRCTMLLLLLLLLLLLRLLLPLLLFQTVLGLGQPLHEAPTTSACLMPASLRCLRG